MKNEKLKDPRRRKMLLVLPLLIIPFLTMTFWALGGGRAGVSPVSKPSAGLNLNLPNAQLKDDRGENKLSYYEEAEKDSAKWREGMENDPLFPVALQDSAPVKTNLYNPYPLQTGDYKDPNEQKVYQKLAELNARLPNSSGYNSLNQGENHSAPSINSSVNKEDVERLEELMNHVSTTPAKDSEVEQLTTMMDRILDIQHPERVKQRLRENQNKNEEEVFDAHKMKDRFTISLLDTARTGEDEQPNAFYGMDNETAGKEANAIEAVVHETQTLADGSIVKMRLLDDVTIGGSTIPKGSFVFGKASLQGERLQVEINSIRKDHALFPVKLIVYDLDGMRGIHVPGAITRDVAKQSADHSLQDIEMSSLDPSLKMQAANAGINAAKTLLSRKVKIVKVTVKAGYNVLLKEN